MPQDRHGEFVLPGSQVYPEGITEGAGNSFYVGSIDAGTIYRGDLDHAVAEVWLPGGLDQRTSVGGLHWDGDGQLVACGLATGHVFVYDTGTGALIARRTVQADEPFLNDVFVVDSTAYLTDSSRPVVWALPLGPDSVGEPAVFCDLSRHGLGGPSYLNGIVATADRSALLVSDQAQEALWRVDLETAAASPVELGDSQLCADGLALLEPGLLIGVSNRGESRDDAVFVVSTVRSDDGWATARVTREHSDPRWTVPTTLAVVDGRVLVVEAQLWSRPEPRLPFRVLDVGSVADVVAG